MTNAYYLRHNIKAVPAVNHWYACPFLIAPITTALTTANLHLPVLKSYLDMPEIHEAAAEDEDMLGAHIINFPSRQLEFAASIIDTIESKYTHLLKFAAALASFNDTLQAGANGYSLEKFYAQLPEELRGYVELTYDLNNHASVRFIEGLLYKSELFIDKAHSLSLSSISHDDRAFSLSTPVINSELDIIIQRPFADPIYDKIFAMRETATSISKINEIIEMLGWQNSEAETRFLNCFSKRTPVSTIAAPESGIKISYFGHACLLIQSADLCILTDPVISYAYDTTIPRYSYADLPEKIDYVLITHSHQDHVFIEHLLQLRYKINTVIVPKANLGQPADPALKWIFKALGFKQVIELDEIESISIAGGEIVGIPFLGEHADLNIQSKLAYLIRFADKSLLCAADSNNLDHQLYRHIQKIYPKIDILFLGMECEGAPMSWAYKQFFDKPIPHSIDQSRRFDGSNCQKALALVELFQPEQVYIYAMGQEPWLKYIMGLAYQADSKPIVESNELIKVCKENNIYAERLYSQKQILLAKV